VPTIECKRTYAELGPLCRRPSGTRYDVARGQYTAGSSPRSSAVAASPTGSTLSRVARATLQEPELQGPQAGEETLRELKLLVDHRDDLVDEGRRCQQRLRRHVHARGGLPPTVTGTDQRAVWLMCG
jgi:hypothetical protein